MHVRRRGQRPGYRDLVPVAHNEWRRKSAWAPRSSISGARKKEGASRATALGTTIKYLRRTASGAAGNGLGTTIKYL
jgi:hypothetical protein